jgi:hypothetical protein
LELESSINNIEDYFKFKENQNSESLKKSEISSIEKEKEEKINKLHLQKVIK